MNAPPTSDTDEVYALIAGRLVTVRPYTDGELWRACEKHIPEDIRLHVMLRLSKLMVRARQSDAAAKKAAKDAARKAAGIGGRPEGGIGPEVEELIAAGFFQKTARTVIARKRGLSYEKVADLHQRWRRRLPRK